MMFQDAAISLSCVIGFTVVTTSTEASTISMEADGSFHASCGMEVMEACMEASSTSMEDSAEAASVDAFMEVVEASAGSLEYYREINSPGSFGILPWKLQLSLPRTSTKIAWFASMEICVSFRESDRSFHGSSTRFHRSSEIFSYSQRPTTSMETCGSFHVLHGSLWTSSTTSMEAPESFHYFHEVLD